MPSLSDLDFAMKRHELNENTGLLDLPNEIIVHILDYLQTQPLLQHRAVSHRFQNLIIRIVHSRLLRAASLDDRKLILECYHPSAQYTEPYLYCDYLGTPGLSDEVEGQGSIYQIAHNAVKEGTLRKLYSHFRPTRKDPEPAIVRSHPAGDIPGSRSSEAAVSRRVAREAEVVKQNVTLEAHELFSQLCFRAGLVQVGPRRGVFLSNIDIVDQKVVRIWREWLAEKARNASGDGTNAVEIFSPEYDGESEKNNHYLDQLLWVDKHKIAGLKLRVMEKKWRRDVPILVHRDEDQAVGYTLEMEELVMSTTHLMLAVERSLLEVGQDSNRAMIFGSFAPRQDGQQDQEAASA